MPGLAEGVAVLPVSGPNLDRIRNEHTRTEQQNCTLNKTSGEKAPYTIKKHRRRERTHTHTATKTRTQTCYYTC